MNAEILPDAADGGNGRAVVKHDPEICGLAYDFQSPLCPGCIAERPARIRAERQAERQARRRARLRRLDPDIRWAIRRIGRRQLRREVRVLAAELRRLRQDVDALARRRAG